MSLLGLPFLTNKLTERYNRASNMRKHGIATHYTSNIDKIKNMYTTSIQKCKILN
jgi:hypothetical protein